MSQTESDRFNTWWWSNERDIAPSKAHAWAVWWAATKALEAENAKLVDVIVEGQGVGALPHDGMAYGFMPKRIAELEAENERLRRGMSQLCREFREAAQEDSEEGGAMAAAYSYYAERIDVLMRRP